MTLIDDLYFVDCGFLQGSTQALVLVLPHRVVVKTWSLVKEGFGRPLVLMQLGAVQNTGLVRNFNQINYWSNCILNVW